MEVRKLHQNSYQFDYFSENYLKFEADFHKYSNLDTPLAFLVDDILATMATGQKNYFRMPAFKSKDQRHHYFYFKIHAPQENSGIRIYEYLHHS